MAVRRLAIVCVLLAAVAGPTVARATTPGHDRRAPAASLRAVAAAAVLAHQTIRAGRVLRFPVTDVGAVPLSGVAAVRLHLVLLADAATSLTIWAADTERPARPTIAVKAGHRVVDVAVAPAADGMVRLASDRDVVGSATVTGLELLAPSAARGVDWSQFDRRPLASTDGALARRILVNANSYALSYWWPVEGVRLLAELTPPIRAKTADDPIRQLAMQAYSLAASLGSGAFQGYDVDGVDTDAIVATRPRPQRAAAQAVVATIVSRLVLAHVSNTPVVGWGGSWQNSLWAALIERAAMMQWSALTAATHAQLARMAEYEADYVLRRPVRYLRDSGGRLLTVGDTGAEEDSWFALAPATAAAMLPTHPHRAAWEHKAVDLMLAAWARPSVLGTRTVVNGAPVSAWLHGSNVQQNGGLINHKRVAPDYSTTLYQNLDTLLTNSLLGLPTPKAATWMLNPVYGALSSYSYRAPPFDQPGGTVYRRTGASVYYPQGCDWGVGQQAPFALIDAQAAAFGFGNLAKLSAVGMEQRHLRRQLALQQRHLDRHTYAAHGEDNYVGREAHVAQLAAQIYLSVFVRDRHLAHVTNQSYWYSSAFAAEYDTAAAHSDVPVLYEQRLMLRSGGVTGT